ncbi:UDP-glucose 4-epimerase GalE [Dongia sedimenti]|uniref:UDP-glucose 4-epimerase n=1 Tax=Dongia sedimenti TaxID=3064282 RepID=A0ABU0YKT8_9PROT|nr:UDP-glucose 4-epimerase GalE [Rhodospirillaceae bacterium R-7]
MSAAEGTSKPAVLVTGGAGYVGSHVCKALDRAGFLPVVYDNLATGHRWAVKWGPLEEGDVRDSGRLETVLRRYRATAVLHFAALSLVGASAKQPLDYYDVNVNGALSLAFAMQASGLRRLVFSSTCAVYGMPATMPISEDAPTLPVNVYGRTKLAAENLFSDLARAGTLDVVMLRYFNAAGADRDGEIGEAHDPESHLIPLAIQAALGEGKPLSLFGTDYPTPDGTCLRDYIHVEDLADAHLKALQLLETTSGAHAFNLGTGIGVSVRDVLAAVGKLAGKPVPVIESPRREGDPPQLYASPAKAERALGWKAAETHIESMVGSAINWHRKARSAA